MSRYSHIVAGWVAAAVVLTVCAAPALAKRRVAESRHNLSASGPGQSGAVSESMICEFCHTPHNGSPQAPMWNRYSSGATYIPYSSTTMDATVGQPTGVSKLCLSCHDGTVALGKILSRVAPVQMRGGGFIPNSPALLGTDLSDDHPISFVYDGLLASRDPELKHPSTLAREVQLDSNSELQCTSCHDAHNDEFGKFLVMDNIQSRLCTQCHQKRGWAFSSHSLSTRTWNGAGVDPWPTTDWVTVQDNGCENCHQPHTAPSHEWLLHRELEEENCYTCHNGNAAQRNVQLEFAKQSRHPVASTSGVHDPEETPGIMNRHVECQDCHNPHAAREAPSVPPAVPGALDEVTGVNLGGTFVAQATYTFEVCFKCHADGLDKPGSYVARDVAQDNTRLEFGAGSMSFHPVASAGRNPDVPSLLAPYTTTSIIGCTDCHNSDAGVGGARGPHGSSFPPLLERQYILQDNIAESPQAYALCYKCHDRDSILNDVSFKEHDKHIRGEDTPCFVCHDAHAARSGAHLINFATESVTPSSAGTLEFVDNGRFQGACSLRCHGKDHVNETYP